MKVTTVCLFLALIPALGRAVCYRPQMESLKVEWVAYKTPLRQSVAGTFAKIKTRPAKGQGTLAEILQGAQVEIETSSVATDAQARDKSLKENFFAHFKNPLIKARFSHVGDKRLTLEVFMSGVKKTLPLRYQIAGDNFSASGHIDLLDFALGGALSELTKACYALHEGKTWSDVEIKLQLKLVGCGP